jgi:Transmembrane domain of unknown function (DUF3566)
MPAASAPRSGSSYPGSSYPDSAYPDSAYPDSAYPDSAYQGNGSSYSGTAYAPSPGAYIRPDWSPDPTAVTPAAPETGFPAGAPSAGPATSANGYAPSNGYPGSGFSSDTESSTGSGFSAGAGFSSGAAAVSGAAAGLASSVASAWGKRGSNGKQKQAAPPRKSSKRQAMLTLARVEPWSVMKFSFVASVVAFVILFVAVAVLYMVLSALGVFDSLQSTVSSITSSQNTAGTNISHWFSASLILGYTAMLGALNIVLITAMATVGSVIYNIIAKTIGGIEVTLRETD